MIGAFQLEELFIDRVSVRHFDYIIVEDAGDEDHHKMMFHIEYYKDSQVQCFTVMTHNIIRLIKPKEPEFTGVIARVDDKEISFIFLDVLQIGMKKDYSDYSDISVVPDYDSIRSYMSDEPRRMKNNFDPVYIANMETLFFTKYYIFIFQNYLPDVKHKDWKKVFESHDLLSEMLFELMELTFGKCDTVCGDFSTVLVSYVLFIRTCKVCHKKSHKRCSLCHYGSYCSKECQAKDWPEHKKNCQKMDGAFLKLVSTKTPIRVQAYFEDFYKKSVFDYTLLKKKVFHRLVDEFHNDERFKRCLDFLS